MECEEILKKLSIKDIGCNLNIISLEFNMEDGLYYHQPNISNDVQFILSQHYFVAESQE